MKAKLEENQTTANDRKKLENQNLRNWGEESGIYGSLKSKMLTD